MKEGDIITRDDGKRIHLYREVSNYKCFIKEKPLL